MKHAFGSPRVGQSVSHNMEEEGGLSSGGGDTDIRLLFWICASFLDLHRAS